MRIIREYGENNDGNLITNDRVVLSRRVNSDGRVISSENVICEGLVLDIVCK